MTGEETLDHDFNILSQEDLENGELKFGLPAALIILLLVFGAVVAGLIPLLMAIVSIIVALGFVSLLAQPFELSVFVINMLTGMGLALGIDYSCSSSPATGRSGPGARAVRGNCRLGADRESRRGLQRHRVRGGDVRDVARAELDHAEPRRGSDRGRNCLGRRRDDALAGLLGLLGDRVDSLRVPFVGRRVLESAGSESRFWGGIVRRVLRRPGLSLVLSAGLLVVRPPSSA